MPGESPSWFYIHSTLVGTTEQVGPVSQNELVKLARDGKIKRDTLVSCPSRATDKWYELAKVPGLLKALEAGEQERAAVKAAEAQHRAEASELRRQQQEAEKRELVLRKNTQVEQAALISEGQDPEMVLTIAERVRAILTSAETLRFIVVQQRPLVNISPDAVVITSRRLIFYRPKLLGRFEFEDYLLFDLFNAHVDQRFMTSVFTAQHTSGQLLRMEWLPKTGALKLYRLTQEIEEHARLARLQLDLETRRAGAANININNALPPPPPTSSGIEATVVSTGQSGSSSDLKQRLQTLKEMADAGLVTQAEYEERKRQILAEL